MSALLLISRSMSNRIVFKFPCPLTILGFMTLCNNSALYVSVMGNQVTSSQKWDQPSIQNFQYSGNNRKMDDIGPLYITLYFIVTKSVGTAWTSRFCSCLWTVLLSLLTYSRFKTDCMVLQTSFVIWHMNRLQANDNKVFEMKSLMSIADLTNLHVVMHCTALVAHFTMVPK